MSATTAETGSLPAELLASDTVNALARHVLPPIFPSPVDYKLAQAHPPRPSRSVQERLPRRSPREHTVVSHSSPSASDSRAPTSTTLKLFELYGDFSFTYDDSCTQDLIDSLRSAQLPPSSPAMFLQAWNVTLALHERPYWMRPKNVTGLVPSYADRARGNLGGTGGVDEVVLRSRPLDEEGLSTQFREKVGQQVDNIFNPDMPVLDPEVLSALVSTSWGAPQNVGSGTADMSMQKPPAMTQSQWSMYRNVIGEFKLLPEHDLAALIDSAKRVNVRGGCAGGHLEPGKFTQGNPPVGFTVCLNRSTGSFETDADHLPDVFSRILPQVAEEFTANHAQRILLGNWDQFVVLTLINAHTASISSMIYRDPSLHPNISLHPSGTPLNPVLIEIIAGAILATGMAADASLWRDMDTVRAAVREDERERATTSKRTKFGRGQGGTESKGHAKLGSPTTQATHKTRIVATLSAAPEWTQGVHSQHTGPIPGEEWLMVAPDSVHELINRLHLLDQKVPPQDDTEAALPPLVTTPTQSPPSSPLQPSPDRLMLQPVTLHLDCYLGTGRMYDVYAGVITIGDTVQDAAFKYINLSTFSNDVHCGGTQLAALDNEVDILQRASEAAPGIAPRLLGLFTRGRFSDEYILALEDCGNPADLSVPQVVHDVRTAYEAIHAAGLVHGDVHPRHVLCDKNGRVRIIDFEGGRLDSDAACEEEQTKVEHMS